MGSNANFSSGSTFSGRMSDLEYFDKLPPSARKALANAAFDWASGAVYNRWKKAKPGYKTGADVASRIAEWDAKQITKDSKRVWGNNYPAPTFRKQRKVR